MRNKKILCDEDRDRLADAFRSMSDLLSLTVDEEEIPMIMIMEIRRGLSTDIAKVMLKEIPKDNTPLLVAELLISIVDWNMSDISSDIWNMCYKKVLERV